MRLWSLHPQYLDPKGLVALWREALLAKHVLEGRTTGYRNHPQLDRFRQSPAPVDTIHYYLSVVYTEACKRTYSFDYRKFRLAPAPQKIAVTTGQINYEASHLLAKLQLRDPEGFKALKDRQDWTPHPLFSIIPGPAAPWEIIR
jgi:hypothetical protein